MGIKENLQKLMDGRRISEYRLAIVTRVPQPTIHRIRTGQSKDPKTETVRKIANYFGVSVDDLRGTGKEWKEATGRFSALSPDAIELLAAWERLPADRQQAFKDSLFFEAFALEQMPWLKRGRPIKEAYDDYERRMKNLGATKQKKPA